jgi:hypothetical protein
MGADSRLENIQTVSDASKGNAKELRRISGPARDVLNAARRELQPAVRGHLILGSKFLSRPSLSYQPSNHDLS